jgi:hypothetical protein
MAIELTIHGTGTGMCVLSGKEGEGLTVSFGDGTVKEAFLSTKAFHQLVKMKCGGGAKKPPVPQAQPVNGPPVPSKT